MRISIAAPPVRDLYFSPGRNSALGLITVSRILERMGHSVHVLNCPGEYLSGTRIPPLPETSHLAPYFIQGERGPVSFFTGYRRFGPGFSQCAERILDFSPDIILISSFAWAYADDTVELIRVLRDTGTELIIGAGGAGISAFPEYFLENGADFAIAGEGEPVMKHLISEMEKQRPDFSNIPNCYYKDAGKIIPPETEVSAEEKDLDFIWNITGKAGDRVFISTSLSRGCPRRCRFCSNFITHGRRFRKVPLEKIRKGIKSFPGFNHTVINFEDDNLSYDPDYLFRVLDIFASALPGVSFMAENGMDYSFLDESIVGELAKYGFRQFNLSIGTLNTAGAAAENRHLILDRYERVLDAAKKFSIPAVTYFICGLERDSPESVAETMKYLAALPTLSGISPFYPVPGIPGFTSKKLFRDHSPSLCRGASFYPWNNTLTTAQMVTAFRLSRFINLKKKGNKTDFEKNLIERTELTGKIHTAVRKDRRNIIIPVPLTDKSMVENFFS